MVGQLIGIAYVDRKVYRKQNKQNFARLKRKQRFCSFERLKTKINDVYNSIQTYVHCEIVFDSSNIEGKTCRAYAALEEGVITMERTFSNPAYRWIYLSITNDEYLKAIEFCENQVGKEYDTIATSWRLLVWPPTATQDKWWCASFVHAVLQKIGMLRNYSLNTLDVDDIVNLISQSERKTSMRMTPLERENGMIEFTLDMFGEEEFSLHHNKNQFLFSKINMFNPCQK